MGWFKRKWNWAKEKPFAWANLALALLVVCIVFVVPSPNGGDLRLRLVSLLLQLIGAWTVWRDLTSTARHFGKPGIIDATADWLKRGFARQRMVIGIGTASIGVCAGNARAVQRRTLRPELPLDERVANLEAVAQQIDDDLSKAHKEIDARAVSLEGKVKAEAAARSKEIEEVRRSVESAAVGNFSKLAFGAFWLAVGAVLSALAPEIAKVVAGRGVEVWRAL